MQGGLAVDQDIPTMRKLHVRLTGLKAIPGQYGPLVATLLPDANEEKPRGGQHALKLCTPIDGMFTHSPCSGTYPSRSSADMVDLSIPRAYGSEMICTDVTVTSNRVENPNYCLRVITAGLRLNQPYTAHAP